MSGRKVFEIFTDSVWLAFFALSILVLAAWPRGDMATLTSHGHTYRLERVTTDAAREKGLGGRASMPTDHGMIFAYMQPGEPCFWMKDMHFPLDIIWVNSAKRVIYMQQNLSPNTYPKTYCPDAQTQYVIELNAGQAQAASIKLGSTLGF